MVNATCLASSRGSGLALCDKARADRPWWTRTQEPCSKVCQAASLVQVFLFGDQ